MGVDIESMKKCPRCGSNLIIIGSDDKHYAAIEYEEINNTTYPYITSFCMECEKGKEIPEPVFTYRLSRRLIIKNRARNLVIHLRNNIRENWKLYCLLGIPPTIAYMWLIIANIWGWGEEAIWFLIIIYPVFILGWWWTLSIVMIPIYGPVLLVGYTRDVLKRLMKKEKKF